MAGSLGPGERLPPVRGLATVLGVTPETVAGAYKRLVDEGYLLAEDLELVVGQASRRYDILAMARDPIAAG